MRFFLRPYARSSFNLFLPRNTPHFFSRSFSFRLIVSLVRIRALVSNHPRAHDKILAFFILFVVNYLLRLLKKIVKKRIGRVTSSLETTKINLVQIRDIRCTFVGCARDPTLHERRRADAASKVVRRRKKPSDRGGDRRKGGRRESRRNVENARKTARRDAFAE